MGFRLRRSIRIAPGFRLNLSKSGVSTSVGTRGAWFTIGPRGTRSTVGIPGTGLSYTEQSHAPSNQPAGDENVSRAVSLGRIVAGLAFVVAVFGIVAAMAMLL